MVCKEGSDGSSDDGDAVWIHLSVLGGSSAGIGDKVNVGLDSRSIEKFPFGIIVIRTGSIEHSIGGALDAYEDGEKVGILFGIDNGVSVGYRKGSVEGSDDGATVETYKHI